MVFRLLPDPVDAVGSHVNLGRPGGVTGCDHANVERGLASIGRDGEHVVFARRHRPDGDLFGASTEGLDELLQLDRGLHGDRGRCPPAVVALGDLGGG